MIPVARRVLGETDEVTLRMKSHYACGLYDDPAATLADLREAVTTLEETTRTGRRVMGRSHPLVLRFEQDLRNARGALRACEESDVCEAAGGGSREGAAEPVTQANKLEYN